jgi:hypothetical protein
VPHGKAARSVLSLITSQYVRQHRNIKDDVKKRTIVFDNLAKTASNMGYTSVTGGKTGSATKINEAIKQLSVTIISTSAKIITDKYKILQNENYRLMEMSSITWSRKDREETQGLFQSYIIISSEFASIIEKHAVPVDLLVYNSLKTARQQDLYAWIVRRMKTVKRDVRIPYDDILPQFFDKFDHKSMRKNELRQGLLEVRSVYPEAKIEADEDGIILHPSRLHIDEENKGFV